MVQILVTGAGGQVGREVCRLDWPSGTEVVPLTATRLDISKPSMVARTVAAYKPDVIVNAAAYTAVDQAESDAERALAVNGFGVDALATAANATGALLVHLSTDYVFDGSKAGWYTEADPISPLGVYGRSKALGEAAAASADKYVTLRTAWVYGALGKNFVTTMMRLARERDELGVVADQFGCPTAAADIAAAIAQIIAATDGGRDGSPNKLYHLASPDDATWHQFALAIFDATAHGFGGNCRPITTAEYPTPAQRPANSRLSSQLIADELEINVPSWKDSLGSVVAELEGLYV